MDFILNPLDSWVALVMWFLLIILVYLGIIIFRVQKIKPELARNQSKALIYLGFTSLALGFVGLILQYQKAFTSIELAEDISPTLVAGEIKKALYYPLFGFLQLAISLGLRFIITWTKGTTTDH